MKRIIQILILFFTIILTTGCTSSLQRIDYAEFEKMIKNNESFIILISQDNCSHCEEYTPKFKKVLKSNNLTAYNLNITYISDDDYEKFAEKYNFEGTPTTLFIKDGKELESSRLTGDVSNSKLKKTLKNIGYIK